MQRIIFTTLCPPLVAPNFCHLEVTTGSSDVGLGGLYACLCHAVHGRQKREARQAQGLPNLTANKIRDYRGVHVLLGQLFFALPNWLGNWPVKETDKKYMDAPLYVTVAVWTQKNFFPLLIRPQGSQGCQKSTFFFQKWNCFPFALRLPLKDTNFKKPSKLKKKCQKNHVFSDFFEYSSIWGQS